jgi:apolipoprotein N-acyltransferase
VKTGELLGVGFASVSALLLILAQPPFGFILLPFVALVPLIVGIGSLRPGDGSARKAVLLGASFGVLHWGILLVWVPLSVAPRFPWAYPGYLAQVGLLSLLTALMALGIHVLNGSRGVPMALAFPLAWVSMEWLKGHFPFGLAFPWLGLSISLTSWPDLVGPAEWTGEAGLAFWLGAVNALLASSLLQMRRTGTRPALRSASGAGPILLAGVVALPVLAGAWRVRTLDLEEGPRVAVVGTEVSRDLRLLPRESTREALSQVRQRLSDGAVEGIDLLVLPEATVAVPLDGPRGAEAREVLRRLASDLDTSILVGSLGTRAEGGGTSSQTRELLTNSAFLFRPGEPLAARYDKVRLVPGMEWGGYVPGRPGFPLRAGDRTFGPLICYESLFAPLARGQRLAGAEVLVNLSSDIWFGEGAGFTSSLFLHQHAAHLVMRAVENRVGVARSANGGFSFLLDPVGRLLTRMVPPQGGLETAEVPVWRGKTLYARTGDVVGSGAFLAFLLLLGPWPRLFRRSG